MAIKADFLNQLNGLSIQNAYIRIDRLSLDHSVNRKPVLWAVISVYKDKAARDSGLSPIETQNIELTDNDLIDEIVASTYSPLQSKLGGVEI